VSGADAKAHEPAIFTRPYRHPAAEVLGGAEMAKIQTESLEEAIREPKFAGFLEAIGGPKFLAAQVFTILATTFGVYLAGYVGFQRTLEYDRFTKAQQRSDLITAMREELKQNVDRLRKFNERLPAESGTGLSGTEWPHLRLFVWQAAGRSTSAMDMPPRIMIDVQSLYDDVNDMLNEAEARQAFKSLTSSNTYYRTQYKERLNNQLKFAEASIFPVMDEATTASAQLLKKYADQKDSKP
jgi:hypothetical protein